VIVEDALSAGVEGVTIIGGEPFDQPAGVGDLAEAAQDAGLGVIVFSGYQFEDLRARGAHESRVLAATDLLIDGPYDAANPEEQRSLIGSANQRFLHLTNRYASFDPYQHRNRVDVRVRPDGTIDVAGFLDTAGLTALAEATSSRRQLPARVIRRGAYTTDR
jgi:anaerobic ribonucleoside-triphosphate reductase activating protein